MTRSLHAPALSHPRAAGLCADLCSVSIRSEDVFVFSQDSFKRELVKWVVLSDQPFTEVDNVHFRSVVDQLRPDVRAPSAGRSSTSSAPCTS
jgi:hypothetical protein